MICIQGPKIYSSLKFGGPTLKNETFQILTIFENFFEKFWDPKSKFHFQQFLAILRSTYSEIFKPLAQKLREEF